MNLIRPKTSSSPIVLLHGWGMNKEIWRGLHQQLPKALAERIIALDLPGYGDAKTCLHNYDLENLTDWLTREITEPSHVIGWSLGGLVALQYAHNNPEQVLTLGLIASNPMFVANETWPGIQPQVLASFSEQLKTDHNALLEKFMAIQAMGSETAKQDIKQIKQWLLSARPPNKHALSAGLEILMSADLRSEFSNLQVPTSMILGRLDSLVPPKVINLLQGLNANVSVTKVNKASHAPFISHPEVFLSWLQQALKQE